MHRIKTSVTICILALLLVGCAWPVTGPVAPTDGNPPTVALTPTAGPEQAASTAPPTASAIPTADATATAGSTVQEPVGDTPPAGGATASVEPPPMSAGTVENPVVEIPLSGPVAQPSAEVSGLAWYGDHLILLPQYPDFASREGDGAIYALSKADLLAYLAGAWPGPLEAIPIPFIAPGLADQIAGFEGYEAIAFLGDQVFLTIEADPPAGMRAYLVSGRIAPDLSALTVDTSALAEIPAQSPAGNMSDEALVVVGDRLVTIYEINGADINPSPVAHLFNTELALIGTVPFPHIEYRITDATALDAEGRFWAINYFFPGDTWLWPTTDPLAERYGQSSAQTESQAVERLVEFQYTESDIRLADRAPIQLGLSDGLLGGLGRNWEGLARLDDSGFLLVTDLFPGTILGFVPAPEKD